ncbi:MAG: TolC family protein [Acidobacteriota bacterium]
MIQQQAAPRARRPRNGGRRPLAFLALWLVLLASAVGPASAADAAPKTFHIALVDDGPSQLAGELRTLFETELRALTEGEFALTFSRFQGSWTRASILDAAEAAYADPAVDLVLVTGLVANQIVGLRDDFPKPTFLPLALDADLLGLPRAGLGSGKRHLNYLANQADFQTSLDVYQRVMPIRRLGLLIDAVVLEALEKVEQRSRQAAQNDDVELVLIPYDDPEAALEALIPADVDAVMIDALARLDDAATDRLIAGLIERGMPSFSLYDDTFVRRGMLIADTPESDGQRLARRTALNMQAVMLGAPTRDQPVTFEGKRRLFINMATARAIDVYPPYSMLAEAILIEDIDVDDGPRWTLAQVAREAVRANLDLLAQRFGVAAGAEQIREARALLLPQITSDLSVTRLNGSSGTVRGGFAARRSTSLAVGVRQLLWSEPVRAGIDIERALQRGREAELARFRLDTVQVATVAFLNILRAETQLRVERNNLQLSWENLELAEDRVRIGSASASDVFRWESEVANAQQRAIAARTELLQARENLNRILNRPLLEVPRLEPATLEDPALLIGEGNLTALIDDPRAFQRMTALTVELALAQSPELAALRANIDAQARQLKSAQRSYVSPEVALSGQLSRVLEEDRVAGMSLDGEDDWSVNLIASLPLYEGGARAARVRGAAETLAQLRTQEAALAEQIEQTIRANLHRANGSYNSIALAENGARAARKSLALVTDAYSQGAVSVIELLDAQNAALIADEAASNAVYNFLIDLMNVQRASGRFDFFREPSDRRALIEALNDAVNREE